MTTFDAIAAINDDVNKLYEQGINAEGLVYITHPSNVEQAVDRLWTRGPGGAAFVLHTACGEVEVIGDKWHPTGSVHRMYRCGCNALFIDNRSRSGKCAVCLHAGLGNVVTGRSGTGETWPRAVETNSEGWTWPGTLVRHARPEASEKKRRLGEVFEDAAGDLAFQAYAGPVKLTLRADPELKPYLAAEKTMREVRDRMAQIQRERLDYLAAKVPRAQLDETQPTLSARLGHLKHGPGGSGLSGPCDADCRKCAVERTQFVAPAPISVEMLDQIDRLKREMFEQYGVPAHVLAPKPVPIDPLDVEYDGVTLRELLAYDRDRQREHLLWHEDKAFTPVQRAAVSAHWSAELRAKVAAAKERDRNQVTMEHEE